MWSELQVLIIQNLRNGVMRLWRFRTGTLLSLDVITSFSGATYILDIFFALLLSKRYEEHARSSMEMLNHLSLLWDETYHTKEKNE